jgi:hypothetical protein
MQLRRSLLCLYFLVAYFAALFVTINLVAVAPTAEVALNLVCLLACYYTFNKWRLNTDSILTVKNNSVQLHTSGQQVQLSSVWQNLGYALCLTTQARRKKLIIWRDQIPDADYRRISMLLLNR